MDEAGIPNQEEKEEIIAKLLRVQWNHDNSVAEIVFPHSGEDRPSILNIEFDGNGDVWLDSGMDTGINRQSLGSARSLLQSS